MNQNNSHNSKRKGIFRLRHGAIGLYIEFCMTSYTNTTVESFGNHFMVTFLLLSCFIYIIWANWEGKQTTKVSKSSYLFLEGISWNIKTRRNENNIIPRRCIIILQCYLPCEFCYTFVKMISNRLQKTMHSNSRWKALNPNISLLFPILNKFTSIYKDSFEWFKNFFFDFSNRTYGMGHPKLERTECKTEDYYSHARWPQLS